MKNLCLFTLLVIFLGFHPAKAQYASLDQREINALKKELKNCSSCKESLNPLLEMAEKALNEDPLPIEKIRSEGLLMGDSLKMATLRSVRDATKIYALSMKYRLTGHQKYFKQSLRFLKAWAKTNQATGNPIDETKLEDLFMGYDLIRTQVSEDDRLLIDKWLSSIAEAELHSQYANPKRGTSKNNWNSHRIKIIAMIAYILREEKYYPLIEEEFRSQISKNLYPDGSGFDFHERDALHYHLYNLDPILKAAMTIYRAGGPDFFNYTSPSGASIKKSVDFLVPFATGEKEHIEFANSKSRFDRERAKNNEKGYQPAAFHKEGAIPTLSLAAYFDPEYLQVINRMSAENKPNLQLTLNRVMKNR